MEFFEFLTVVMLFVALPSIIFTNVRKMKEAKYLRGQQASGDALRMSELQLLIEAAVDEATAPLRAQISQLEDDLVLGAPRPSLALDAPERVSDAPHALERSRQPA